MIFFGWLPLNTVEKYSARKRSIWLFFRNVSWLLLIIPVVIYFIGWSSLSFWLTILEALVFIYIVSNAYFKYRFTSLGLTGDTKDDYLVLSESMLFRQNTYYVGWHEIQSMHFDSSIFMEKNKLSHVAVMIRKGKAGKLTGANYIDYDGGKRIYNWYRQ